MDKTEKLSQLKEYLTKIEEDISVSDMNDKQNLMNKHITECLKYISQLIEEIINENSVRQLRNGNRFFITKDQTYELTSKSNARISDIADELNRVTATNNTSKITTTWITDWLISVGILEINNSGQRVPTQAGNDMGITSQLIQVSYSKVNIINYYSFDAQKYIYDNIDNIIDFHYNYKQTKTKLQSKNAFFIKDEQLSQLKTFNKVTVSDIVNELNKFITENDTKKYNL
ncbi:MAG: hypothetical protein HDT23_03230 [Ruminococcus sp.]|nr:hypothetical protein [Ruminococcus sp.]